MYKIFTYDEINIGKVSYFNKSSYEYALNYYLLYNIPKLSDRNVFFVVNISIQKSLYQKSQNILSNNVSQINAKRFTASTPTLLSN